MPSNEIESLRLIYAETGEQLRSNAATRNTLGSFIIVGLSAFFGLTAQNAGALDKAVWMFPAFLGLIGALSVVTLWSYNRKAIERQRDLSNLMLGRATRRMVAGLALSRDKRPRWEQALDVGKWWDRRIDLFFLLVVYLPILIVSVEFARWGDPFGLSTEEVASWAALQATLAAYISVQVAWMVLGAVIRRLLMFSRSRRGTNNRLQQS